MPFTLHCYYTPLCSNSSNLPSSHRPPQQSPSLCSGWGRVGGMLRHTEGRGDTPECWQQVL